MPIDLAKVMDTNRAYSTKDVAEMLEINTNSARQRLEKAFNKDEVLKKVFRGKTYWARKV